jgi:WD40 repeat protein
MHGHEEEVLTVAFRGDCDLLASGSAKARPAAADDDKAAKPGSGPPGEVIVWTVDGELFNRHEYPAPVNHVAYGPKNGVAGACRDGSLIQLNACTGKALVSGRPTKAALCFAAFREDGSILASAGGHRPRLWNVTSGEQIATLESHSFGASSLALSPDGKTLATAGVNELKLWDVASGKLRFRLEGIHGHTYALTFTPDGRSLISGGNNCHARPGNGQQSVELNVWDVASGERRAYFPGKLPTIRSLAVSPDGKTLATGSWKDNIYLWELSAARPISKVAEKAGTERKAK